MFRLALGMAVGAAGATLWLLSTPERDNVGNSLAEILGARGEVLRARFQQALADGKAAQTETENRVRHQFEAFRRHPDRPATS